MILDAVMFVIGAVSVGYCCFVCGVDAAAQLFAARWLELHPEDADLTVGRHHLDEHAGR